MPLLAAIDECHCALTQIAAHAQLASAHPDRQQIALQIIQSICVQANQHVAWILRDVVGDVRNLPVEAVDAVSAPFDTALATGQSQRCHDHLRRSQCGGAPSPRSKLD